MSSTTKTWIVIGIVILIALILVGWYASKKPSVPVSYTNLPPYKTQPTNLLGSLGNLFNTIFKGKGTISNSGFIQTGPIDDQGCDVNGYNAIGVKCF